MEVYDTETSEWSKFYSI